jgi:hypothetical protein
MMILLVAATQSKNSGWFNSTVVVAAITTLGVVIAAYLTYKATTRKEPGGSPNGGAEFAPDLPSAAAARVVAVETYGPARQERLQQSRIDLERAAATLDKKKDGELRSLSLGLAKCTEGAEASRLRDALIARIGSNAESR